MGTSRIRPLDLSSSYFTLEPKGISTTQSNSWGSLSPGVTSCQGWIIGGWYLVLDLVSFYPMETRQLVGATRKVCPLSDSIFQKRTAAPATCAMLILEASEGTI